MSTTVDYKPTDPGYGQPPPSGEIPYHNEPVVTGRTGPPIQQPPDYLALSIITLLLCFWPLGIVALLKSLEVRSHFAAGKYREAEESSKSAKLFNKIGIGIGIGIIVFSVVITVIIVAVSVAVPLAALSSVGLTTTRVTTIS